MIGAFYGLGRNTWEQTEHIWEGVFALMAVVIISLMGAAILRVSKMQDKWRIKIARAMEAKDRIKGSTGGRFKQWCEKYAMFILPFVTVLREGVEAVVFIAGVSLGLPAAAFPLPVLCGLGAGCIIGFFIYRSVFETFKLRLEFQLTGLQRRKIHPSPTVLDCFHLYSLPCRSRLDDKSCGVFRSTHSMIGVPLALLECVANIYPVEQSRWR